MISFSDYLRKIFKGVLDYFAHLFLKIGISPNALTLIGLGGNLVAGIIIALGHMRIGGMIALIMGPLDAVDGCMARIQGSSSSFGGFLDSITDRYSELSILTGLLIYFYKASDYFACLLVFAAVVGSVLVPYIRARGESLGYSVKSGILTRVERYLVIVPALLLNKAEIGLWIIAIFGNLTALQRIWQVWSQTKLLDKKQNKFGED